MRIRARTIHARTIRAAAVLFAFGAVACGTEQELPVEAAPVEAPPAAAAPVEASPAAAAPAAAAAPSGAIAPDQAAWKTFGAPFTVTGAVPVSAVLSDPAAHAAGTVRVEGELTEVCQKAGCWAVVRDDQGRSMRITMKAHDFGIDKDTAGKRCDAEGQLVKKEVDPERVAHFASEGSANAPEQGKTETWELVASSVAVARN